MLPDNQVLLNVGGGETEPASCALWWAPVATTTATTRRPTPATSTSATTSATVYAQRHEQRVSMDQAWGREGGISAALEHYICLDEER